jgi:acetylornithine/N-succinyldiaminopimelate aminotransferase
MTSTTAVMGNYGRADLAFSHGEGSWLISTDGDRYLDFATGIAVNTLGHSHPKLVDALTRQAGKLWHVSNLYNIPEQAELAQILAKRSGLDQVFFCNSGAEATEAAVKMARRAMHHMGHHNRHKILCAEGAFHGRTIAMLAATDRPAFREGFGPMPDGFGHFPFGNMNALRDQLISDAESGAPEIAAVMVESVQGEGGARPLPDGFLAELRAVTNEVGCLLIADEVQIGVGRSGHLFSFEPSGIKPDIIAMAKGLAGGFPIGAVIATEAVGSAMTPGSHGSTFGGNPLAMQAACAVLDVLDADFLAEMRSRSAMLFAELDGLKQKHQAIMEIRGNGFLIGLVLADHLTPLDVMAACRAHHMLVVPAAANTVRLLPPLNVRTEDIHHAVAVLDTVLSACEEKASHNHD